MQRLCAFLLLFASLFASLPCAAQEPIPFKSLANMAAVQPSLSDLREMQNGSSPQGTGHRHWTKGGRIMTYIGVPVMAAGAAMLAYGVTKSNSTDCSDGNTCVSVDWKWTGAAWLGVGGALTVIGLTRHSSE
jgi:hypothetical protein